MPMTYESPAGDSFAAASRAMTIVYIIRTGLLMVAVGLQVCLSDSKYMLDILLASLCIVCPLYIGGVLHRNAWHQQAVHPTIAILTRPSASLDVAQGVHYFHQGSQVFCQLHRSVSSHISNIHPHRDCSGIKPLRTERVFGRTAAVAASRFVRILRHHVDAVAAGLRLVDCNYP